MATLSTVAYVCAVRCKLPELHCGSAVPRLRDLLMISPARPYTDMPTDARPLEGSEGPATRPGADPAGATRRAEAQHSRLSPATPY